MENKKDSEQEFLFVKPEYIDHWSYQIDNGKRHILKEEDVYPYVKSFLNGVNEWVKVVDIIHRHQPFIVSLKKGTCKELHPTEETRGFHKEFIARDLSKVMNGYGGEGRKILARDFHQMRGNQQTDWVDKFLKRTIRSSSERELSDKITQRRLK